MSIVVDAVDQAEAPGAREILISSDSHVLEPRDLWATRLPAGLRDRAPEMPVRTDDKPGATDPHDRLQVLQEDGVSAEILYPTYGLTLFALEDAELQEACFRVYNDWLVEYCQVVPDRLVGIPAISAYNIDNAVKELERAKKLGLKGALLWQVPHPDLRFSSNHYDPLWDAAQSLEMPIALHILSGFNYSRDREGRKGLEQYRGSVGWKLIDAVNTLFDFIFYGALDRFPRLKVIIAENEIGWLPWVIQQWDYYVRRFGARNPLPGSLLPSEYFQRQVYATFINDAVGGKNFAWWGHDNGMWSNDFPHGNTSWPRSREIIARDLGYLPADVRRKLLSENVAQLYGIKVPQPIA